MFSKKTTAKRSLALGLGVGAFVLLQACVQNGDDVQTSIPTDSLNPAGCTAAGCTDGKTVLYSRCVAVQPEQVYGGKQDFYGNARLVRIENGTVPCIHYEKGEAALCKFTKGSGPYLTSKAGTFARVGQAIGLDGTAGGDFVIATKVSADSTVPCVAPTGKDSAGTPTGTELAGSCVVETLNAPTNATGLKVVSFASLNVCTSSYPHPDGAALSSVGKGTYCYKGDGAGLNDINGIETDSTGAYYPQAERCHVIWSNGYEVPGSKRPSTKTLPAPGTVVATTPIVWRPVTSVDVANP